MLDDKCLGMSGFLTILSSCIAERRKDSCRYGFFKFKIKYRDVTCLHVQIGTDDIYMYHVRDVTSHVMAYTNPNTDKETKADDRFIMVHMLIY